MVEVIGEYGLTEALIVKVVRQIAGSIVLIGQRGILGDIIIGRGGIIIDRVGDDLIGKLAVCAIHHGGFV